MRFLLLGVGMQGRATLHDLVTNTAVTHVTAADVDEGALRAHVAQRGFDDDGRLICCAIDARDQEALEDLIARARPDVVIDLLPADCVGAVTRAAVRAGVHLVNTLYTRPEVREVAAEAERRGITILPECGFDPGIDLVLSGRMIAGFEHVTSLRSYGGGIPEPAAADNPLRYKVTWTLAGVLNSYRRSGRVIRDGRVVDIGDDEQFLPEHVFPVDVPGFGTLEAFPNGDALPYADQLGLDRLHLQDLGRFALRWPGHCDFWRRLVALGLLDSEPVTVGSQRVVPRQFLATALEPHLQYAPEERDVVILRIEVAGIRDGRTTREVLQVVDYRDMETGLTAMSRTVGFSASIGAQMIADGTIAKRGVLSPLRDVPCESFLKELERRGIRVTCESPDVAGSASGSD